MLNKMFELFGGGGMKGRNTGPNDQGMEKLIGRIGKTITPLRTAGMIELDGHKYQAESQGRVIPRDKCIRVIGIKFHAWLVVELM